MRIIKINSIDYGGKIICIGLFFMLFIPGVLLFFYRILVYEVLEIFAKASFGISLLILVSFACFLVIELRQDKMIDQYYSNHKNVKVPIVDGNYECGACGNRKIKINSSSCDICGVRFENVEVKTPKEIIERKCSVKIRFCIFEKNVKS